MQEQRLRMTRIGTMNADFCKTRGVVDPTAMSRLYRRVTMEVDTIRVDRTGTTSIIIQLYGQAYAFGLGQVRYNYEYTIIT